MSKYVPNNCESTGVGEWHGQSKAVFAMQQDVIMKLIAWAGVSWEGLKKHTVCIVHTILSITHLQCCLPAPPLFPVIPLSFGYLHHCLTCYPFP